MEGKGYKEMSNRKRTGEDNRKRSKRQKEEVKKTKGRGQKDDKEEKLVEEVCEGR